MKPETRNFEILKLEIGAMRSLLSIIIGISGCIFVPLQAQEIEEVPVHTIIRTDSVYFTVDERLLVQDTISTDKFSPDPMKILWMSAVIPGYGQILNRQYWKIPIVYGGFLVCGYLVSWHGTLYQNYKIGYRDIIDNDPNTNGHLDILPPGYTIDMIGEGRFTTMLKTNQDQYRRYRDLSIFATVAYYGLTILEAYVSAQLYDFDITPDLSISVQPTLLANYRGNPNAFGVQVGFKF